MHSSTHKGSILVVDDERTTLHILENLLCSAGYQVRATTSAPLALTSAKMEAPDLILLDIMMGDINGYQVCQRLKNEECTRQIPIIFLSALNKVENKLQGFSFGGADYITKPFQADELLIRIEIQLKLHRLPRQLHKEIELRTQKEEALQAIRDELEVQVEERTREILENNKQLQSEIEHRKKAESQLQKAYSEIHQLKHQLEQENIYFREEIKLDHNFDEIIGNSDTIRRPLHKVGQVAPTDATVLLLGETGTGKELFARAIHHAGLRRERPLIKVNCAALPSNLIESELFGHEKGAFSGAAAKRIGRFELADGATLFLDEIGELPLPLQAKLLRVLQDGEFERLGSSRTRKVDVRVIAATNRDLQQEIQEGRFRQDLYYRLNVYSITLPPLRRRPEDIPLLLEAFIRKFSKQFGKQINAVPQAALDNLLCYEWPGNVRELENIVEQAIINSQDGTLALELPCPHYSSCRHSLPCRQERPTGFNIETDKTLEELEREYILYILRKTNGKIGGQGGAAQILHMNPGTLRSRMKKLQIKKPHKP